jgi:hypothetical protein
MNKDILSKIVELYTPRAPSEREFFNKHVAELKPDHESVADVKVAGATVKGQKENGDDVFRGSAIKKYMRKKDRYGNEAGEDVKAYRNFAQTGAADPDKGVTEATYNYGDTRSSAGRVQAPNRVQHKGGFHHSTGRQGSHEGGVVHEFEHPTTKNKIWRNASSGSVLQPHHEKSITGIVKNQRGFNEALEERVLTKGELDKREDLVKHMKANKADFKSRYGDRAKEVMYATATKMAKEEVEPSIDESALERAIEEETLLAEVRRGMGRYDKKTGKFTYAIPSRVYTDHKGRHFTIDPGGKRHLLAAVDGGVHTEATEHDVQLGAFAKQDAVNYNEAGKGTSGYDTPGKINPKKLPTFTEMQGRVMKLHADFNDISSQAYGRDYPAGPFEHFDFVSDVFDQLQESLTEDKSEFGVVDILFRTGEATSVTNTFVEEIMSVYEHLNDENKVKMKTMLNTSLDSFMETIEFVTQVRE